jgi:hypothetical protein
LDGSWAFLPAIPLAGFFMGWNFRAPAFARTKKNRTLFPAGGFSRCRVLQVEIVVRQLPLQATFFQVIVDDAALGQVGLGDLNRGRAIVVGVFHREIIFEFDFGFVGHTCRSRLRVLLAHLIATKIGRVKKIFSIDWQGFA